MGMTKKDLQMLKLQHQAQQDFLLRQYLEQGHKMPKNRRDFMRAGLISMAAYVAAPTMIQLISQSAWAAEEICTSSSSSVGMPAFIHVQLDGGAALFANHLPHGNNGDPLPDYGQLGVGTSPVKTLFFSNNAPFWTPDAATGGSEIIRSIMRNIPTTGTLSDIYARTAFVAMSAESIDDRADNKGDITGMLQAAGVTGTMLPYLMGGGTLANNYFPAVLPSANLLNVAGASSLEGSLGLKGSLANLGATQLASLAKQKALVKAIENLNKKQMDALVANDSAAAKAVYKNLISCASKKNSEVLASDNVVNITAADYPSEFGGTDLKNNIWLNNFTDDAATSMTKAQLDGVQMRTGQAVATCLRGMSGACLLRYGGYDYHRGASRAFANSRDKFAGEIIGRILLTARRMNKKVFLYVSTDGSLEVSDPSSNTTTYAGDNPKKSMAYIFAYDPTTASPPPTSGFNMSGYADAPYQLNHFSNSHVVDTKNPISSLDAVDLAASAVFLNYLNFAGKPDLINDTKLAAVKKRLTDSLPTGGKTIADYFTRIKPRS
jgi:hypothetical protein